MAVTTMNQRVHVTVCNVTSSFSSIPQCNVCSAAPQTESLLSHSIGHTVHNLPLRSTTCAACLSSPVLWLTFPDPGIDFFGDSLREPQKNRQLDKLPFLHLQRSVHLANKTPQRWWGCCLVILPTQKAESLKPSVGVFPSFFLVCFVLYFSEEVFFMKISQYPLSWWLCKQRHLHDPPNFWRLVVDVVRKLI